jgi:hypothetical protein
MAIDPKILARMKNEEKYLPQDDGVPSAEYIDGMTPLTGAPLVQREKPLPKDTHHGCAVLTGSWKQRKWAIDLRNDALDLVWPIAVVTKLKSINDATWWIANSSIARTMKFKEPSPEQINGSVGRTSQPEPKTTSAATPSRLIEAADFAASVSRHPLQAEAAILALLAKLYKPPMSYDLKAKATAVMRQANFEIQRDMDAIERLLK